MDVSLRFIGHRIIIITTSIGNVRYVRPPIRQNLTYAKNVDIYLINICLDNSFRYWVIERTGGRFISLMGFATQASDIGLLPIICIYL